jgi:hypothetical protein
VLSLVDDQAAKGNLFGVLGWTWNAKTKTSSGWQCPTGPFGEGPATDPGLCRHAHRNGRSPADLDPVEGRQPVRTTPRGHKTAYSRICLGPLGAAAAASAGPERKERSPTSGLPGGSGACGGAGCGTGAGEDAVRNNPCIFLRLAR